MSEFLAEAQVLIAPNTAGFAVALKKQLEAAVAAVGPVVIPVTAAPVTAGVGKALAAETAVTTAAIKTNTAAMQEQGAMATRDAEAQVALSRAAKLDAQAQLLLGTAMEAGALKTTSLAASRAVLAQTSHAVSVAEKAVAAALLEEDAALTLSAEKTLETALANEVLAKSAVKAAIAEQKAAAAAAESGAAHAQATRGIAAETLSLTGLRGATLAASAPFLAGATAAIVFAKSIKEASNETEELNKTAEVFGQSAASVEEFSKTTATSLGISSTEALKAAGIFGNLFRTIQISEPVAASMSERLVQLASDLASFNNVSPERTLEALRSGLVGQARPLRVFGIFLSAARVQQEALIETQKKSVKELTQAELVQARFNLILRDSNIAQGDFARTSGRLANQSRVLSAQLSNIGVDIGRVLLPALTSAITDVNLLFAAFNNLKGVKVDIPGTESGGSLERLDSLVTRIFGERGARAVKLNALFPGLGFSVNTWTLLDKAIRKVPASTTEATKAISGFHFALGGLQAEIAAMQAVADQVNFGNIKTQLRGLEVQQLKIQTGLAPGGRQAEEANLKQQIADDKKAVAQSKSGTKARKDALISLKQDQDELVALQQQDASDAQDRAQKVKDAAAAQQRAAQDAAAAQAKATEAFISQFSGKNQRLQNKLTSANLFGDAQAQININKLIVAADAAEIKAIQDRIRHLHLHGDALKAAKAEIDRLNKEIFDTRNAILQLQAERKQSLVDARQSHLEAQLAIAETTASTRDDTAAEKALIKFDQVQIRRILAIKRRRRLTLEEAAQLDSYRVDLAQRNAALKDVTKEAQDTGKKMKELTFAFLQAQQGFAANLLGNLIPGFATSGLVGGSSAASGAVAGDPFAFTPNAAEINTGVGGSAAAASSKGATVRPVQVDTTNSLLRQILAALQGRHTNPPEIRHNRSTSASEFDTLGGS